MPVLFADGFESWDGYKSPRWTDQYTYGWGGLPGTFTSGRYAWGRYFSTQNQTDWLYKKFGGTTTTVIAGTAYYINASQDTWWGDRWVFGLWENGTTACHVRVHFNNTDRKLRVYNGNGTLLATGTTVLTGNTWYYLELKAVIHDSTGSVELRIFGNLEASATGADTRNAGSGYVDTILIGANAGSNYGGCHDRWDDLYVLDGSSGKNSDFLCATNADLCVRGDFLPSGAGSNTGWTASTGSNYACVDDASPNTTDFVYAFDTALKDSYQYPNLANSNLKPKAVVQHLYASQQYSAIKALQGLALLSGTEKTPAAQTPASNGAWGPLVVPYDTDPNDNDWTYDNFNACEFGVQANF